jgi:hypothetical protein
MTATLSPMTAGLLCTAIACAGLATPARADTGGPTWQPRFSERLVKLPASTLKKSLDRDFSGSALARAMRDANEALGLKVQTLEDLRSAIDEAEGEVKGAVGGGGEFVVAADGEGSTGLANLADQGLVGPRGDDPPDRPGRAQEAVHAVAIGARPVAGPRRPPASLGLDAIGPPAPRDDPELRHSMAAARICVVTWGSARPLRSWAVSRSLYWTPAQPATASTARAGAESPGSPNHPKKPPGVEPDPSTTAGEPDSAAQPLGEKASPKGETRTPGRRLR